MTQALALRRHLMAAGHTVCRIMVGKSPERVIPPYVFAQTGDTVEAYRAPNFKFDKNLRGVSFRATIRHNLRGIPGFLGALRQIHRAVRAHKPDVIVNFYEVLGGFYAHHYRPRVPVVAVGHQFLLQHPDFVMPPGRRMDRFLLNRNTNVAGHGACAHIALSYRPLPAYARRRIRVLPPLLRPEVFAVQPEDRGFLLVYMVNPGYGDDIIAWHANHRDQEVHVFWDNRAHEDGWSPHSGLTFHLPSDTGFLERLRTCRAYMSTAGFESVCEAIVLGKPVFVVPVEGQYEQACNAFEVAETGVGLRDTRFDCDRFLAHLKDAPAPDPGRVAWIRSAPEAYTRFFAELTGG